MRKGFQYEPAQGKLFNKEVINLLFKYILRYRLYLIVALMFVATITAITIAVPYLSRIIIDRAIIKQGYVFYNKTPQTSSPDLTRKALHLHDDTLFLFQSDLSYLSPFEIQDYIEQGIFSPQKYTLIESPVITEPIARKIEKEIAKGSILRFPSGLYLLGENATTQFTVSEMIFLRAADFKMISRIVLLIIGLFILRFTASYLQILALMKLSQNAMKDLRSDLFSHILSLDLSFFDSNPVGKLVNRVTNDIESLNEMFSSVLITLVQDVIIMASIIVMMYVADFRLAFVVSLTFPPLLAATLLFRLKARKVYRTIRAKISDLNAFLNENISNIRVVQIFIQELKQLNKFKSINNEVYKANIKQLKIYALFRPLIDFFRWLAVGSIIFFGARFILQGRISYGLIVMFLAYTASFFEPIGDLAEKFDILQSATAAGEKILSLFNTPARKKIKLIKNSTHSFKGEIIFDDVWFSYVPGEWVLKGVSFSVSPGSTLAIVGETGSGKSTIINLLGCFYSAQRGKITIDGTDINTIPVDVLRSNIASVMQDVFLFSRTVKENITLGNKWEQKRFEHVTKVTHLNHFLSCLPSGCEHVVMERGVTFSAGERQLLAFTRALYFNPSILILDEATSNIDTETENLIQDAISHLIEGRTSIVIAHRLSTIRHAEKILVLNNGIISESGNHDFLIQQKGLYYDLYRLQFDTA